MRGLLDRRVTSRVAEGRARALAALSGEEREAIELAAAWLEGLPASERRRAREEMLAQADDSGLPDDERAAALMLVTAIDALGRREDALISLAACAAVNSLAGAAHAAGERRARALSARVGRRR